MYTQPIIFVAFAFATTLLAGAASLPKSCNGTITLTAGHYLADGQDYGPHPCTIIGQSGTVISGNFTAASLDLMGTIRFESRADRMKWFNIWDSHVAFGTYYGVSVVSVSDGVVQSMSGMPIRIDGGSVSANGYLLDSAGSPGGLIIGSQAIVHFTKTRVILGMGDLFIEGGADLALTDGSYLYSRANGISHIHNASASVVDSRMVHMKTWEISKSNFTLRRSGLEIESNQDMRVEESFLNVEDSSLKHRDSSLNLVRSFTTFRNATLTGQGHNVVGGKVSYVNSSVTFGFGFFRLSLESDSQVPIINSTIKSDYHDYPATMGGFVVSGEPSIYIDKSSQIHCASGHFVPQSGHNGSITVEGSAIIFPSCNSSGQASVADTVLEGPTAAVFI